MNYRLGQKIKAILGPFAYGSYGFSYDPLIKILISKGALIHNFNEFQSLNSGRPVAPVLKSNAYGHGLTIVAKILALHFNPNDLPFFVIDSYFEALTLRQSKLMRPLLVMGYTPTELIVNSNLKKVTYTITSLDALQDFQYQSSGKNLFSKNGRPIPIHLKIDTGMHRQGVLVSELVEAIDLLKKLSAEKKIILTGISTHFADSDNQDDTFTRKQIIIWNEIVQKFRVEFPSVEYWHASNTAGHHYADEIDANISRLGMGLYGIDENAPVNLKVSLKPVLEMSTVITSLKKVPTGEKIGYNGTHTALEDTMIATIPAGYFEGIDRRLSNKGYLTIENHFAPIVGLVSMNITTLNVQNLLGMTDLSIGTPVKVVSSEPTDPNSVENIAKTCGTIPYEILVHIPAQLKRIVVE